MMCNIQKVGKEEYLQFHREVLVELEKDFPKKFIEQCTLRQFQHKIVDPGNLLNWAYVEASMYEFTEEKEYLRRAYELFMFVIQGIEKTPKFLWSLFDYYSPQSYKLIQEVYKNVPGSVFCVGSFHNPLPLGQSSRLLEKFGAWKSKTERERVKKIAAEVMDYRITLHNFYDCDNEKRNNRTLTSARGLYQAALSFPEHPHAEKWRQWAEKQFRVNLNQPSDEDASGYQADWFYSILNIIERTDRGRECYFLPYHRAYFEHFRDLITSGVMCADYGDSTGANSAHLPILEKGATIFNDGSYKYAAACLFRETLKRYRPGAIPPERWLDAYRWADDSIEPTLPRAKSTITGEGKVILRIGDEDKISYLSLTSNDLTHDYGKGHGHVDANAVCRFVYNGSSLLEDGAYQWKDAVYHNRVLWRKGKPPGKVTDYFRPREIYWYKTSNHKMVFPDPGPREGVERGWHPSSEVDIKVQFLAEFPQFTATKSILGPQERTIILDREGRCLIFDYLDLDEPTTSICLYYTRKVLERGAYWVKGESSSEDSDVNPLFAFLEPRKADIEPETRNRTTEQLIYSFSEQSNPWFVSLLLPCPRKANPQSLLECYKVRALVDEENHPIAQLLTREEKGKKVVYSCRKKEYPKSILYPNKIKTDAELMCFQEKKKGIQLTLVDATFLEYQGRTLVKSSVKINFSKVLEKGL